MRRIAAGTFKARCLKIMDEVQARRQPVVITKRGKPVVKLVPAGKDRTEIYNSLRGKVRIIGDILSPAIDDWGSLK